MIQIHHHQLSGKEFVADIMLFMGTVGAIFVFGLAALPWVQVS